MKKFSWGTGILIVIILFMSVTIFTGVYLMNQDVDLVAEDYYDREIKYQQQINKMERTNELEEKISIDYNEKKVIISVPESYNDKRISGEVYFFRPSDGKQDFKIPFTYNNEPAFVFPVDELSGGYWRVQIHWEFDAEEYYTEKKIFIE